MRKNIWRQYYAKLDKHNTIFSFVLKIIFYISLLITLSAMKYIAVESLFYFKIVFMCYYLCNSYFRELVIAKREVIYIFSERKANLRTAFILCQIEKIAIFLICTWLVLPVGILLDLLFISVFWSIAYYIGDCP